MLTVLALGMYVSSGVWSLVVQRSLGEEVKLDLTSSIRNYDIVPAYASNLDVLHARVSMAI